MDLLLLGVVAFFTSCVASVVGVGGGLMLIAILPYFFPIQAVIPIHGLTQLSSNLSRAYFSFKDIEFDVVPKFLVGSIAGVGIIIFILDMISIEYIPLFIGVYILLSLWSRGFNEKIKHYENYYLIGFLQSGLSMAIGTTGPLTLTLLYKDYKEKNKVVATSALLMSITHFMKVIAFIYFGFVFSEYIEVILVMVLGVTIGSYFGTKIRDRVDGKKLLSLIKIVLSILGVKLIIDWLI